MKTYKLVNNEGCIMTIIKADSIKEAKGTFKESYSGDYKIVCEEDTHHVKL